MNPLRLPFPLRLAALAGCCAAILWLSLAPSDVIPSLDVSDKLEHAWAYAALAALGLWAFPRRPLAVALAAVALGIAIEFVQAAMGFGRQGDIVDAAADALGVAAGLASAAAARWWLAKPA